MSRMDWKLTPMSSFDVEQGGRQLRTWWLQSSGVGVDRWTWLHVRVFPEFPRLVPFIVLLLLSVSALAY